MNGLARIDHGEPLAYVTGSQPFWTLDLKVTHDTLVPRPDTEILIETVLKLELDSTSNVVDLGTGTGAIALALASERPQWKVTATDIYQPTLEVAQENAIRHGLTHIKFACGAWFDALEKQFFDLIVSNPPYIDPEDLHMQMLKSEPERALIADKQGLADLETIIVQGKGWLNPNGWIVLEHGYDQGEAVRTTDAPATTAPQPVAAPQKKGRKLRFSIDKDGDIYSKMNGFKNLSIEEDEEGSLIIRADR